MFWPDILPRHCESAEGRRGNLNHSKERHVWARIRILHETDKAALIDKGMKIWIPKSRIRGIRMRNNIFEIYVKESTVGYLFRMFYSNSYGFTSNRSYAQRFQYIRRFAEV